MVYWNEEMIGKIEAEEDELLPQTERHYGQAHDQAQSSLGWLATQLGFVSRAGHRLQHATKEQWLAEKESLRRPLDAALDSIAATRNKYATEPDALAQPVQKKQPLAASSYTLPNGVTVTTGPIADSARRTFGGGCHGRARASSAFGPRGRRGRFAGKRQHRFAARAQHFLRFHARHNLLPMLRLLLAFGGAVVVVKALTRAAVRAKEGGIRLPVAGEEQEQEEEEVVQEKASVKSAVVEVVVEKQ